MRTYAWVAMALMIFFSSSCRKKNSTVIEMPDVIAPKDFNFSTTKNVNLDIKLLSSNNQSIAGVPVNFYKNSTDLSAPIYKAITDANGHISANISIPSYMDTLIIDPQFTGLIRYAKAFITNNTITAVLGGEMGSSGNIAESSINVNKNLRIQTLNNTTFTKDVFATTYSYMGTYTNKGVPNYLEPTKDVITTTLLEKLNESLPESQDIREHHPQYLESSAVVDLNIVALADVWITFVGEGAGYLNSLGFYTYPTGNPPTSASQITDVKYIFPNASLPNSGGNLQSGSKVKIGTFNPGTSIGFVILANAWNSGSRTVNSNATKFYTTSACNPEVSNELKKHSVLLYDEPSHKFIIGMDDQNRERESDQDLNDLLFYASSNPITAISDDNVRLIDTPTDTDNDGVKDSFDQFPNDPTKAYINYYPSKTTYGSLLFEDLWPATGDYDLNDMVVGYRYKTILNASNSVVELYADYFVRAAGASYINGFGVEFPFASSLVKNVTGNRLVANPNYINLKANGTENLQSKAVIIPFDDYRAIIKRPGGFYINTQADAPVVKGDTLHMVMTFNSPISSANFGNPPFNPFLISNGRRAYEVHLPGALPTDLADRNLFSTLQDYTQPNINYYYKSKNSWPWALNLTENFDYPSEGNAISKSYTYFLDWAKNGGSTHADWYINSGNNINTPFVYKK